MKRILNRRNVRSFKNESVEDPHELLLSLVDLGSLDADEALLACVKEMSDAECKRVLGSLSLPNGAEEVEEPEDDMDGDLVPLDDEIVDDSDDFAVEDEEPVEDEAGDEDADVEECNNRELEAKVRRLERLAFGKKKELKTEATRYYYEWEPDYDRCVKIFNSLLADPEINPENLTIKDFKLGNYSDGFSAYGIDGRLNLDAPAAQQILTKAKSFKTYDVQTGIFPGDKGGYITITCKKKVRKSEWYDPEFGPGFDRDLYAINRRYSNQYGRH